jgi:hypothetical protein
VNLRRTVAAIATLLLLAATGSLWGQVDGEATVVRRLLTVIDFGPDAAFDHTTRAHLRASLISTLTREQTEAAVILYDGDSPGSDRELTETALEHGASAWLAVTIEGSPESARYQSIAFDLVARKYLFEVAHESDQGIRTRDLARRFWSDIAALLGETLKTVIPGTEIAFVGAPGTKISGITDEPIVLDGDGRAVRTLINPNYYEYRATRIGFYPVKGALLVGDDPKTVELVQPEATRHTIEVGLTTLNFPTVAYRYDVIPQWVFTGASITSYSLGYSLADRGPESDLFVSLPLQEIRVVAGGFFLPVDAPVRPYGALFAGTRLVTASEFFGLDPLSRVQAGVILGAEFPVFRSIVGYAELFPTTLLASYPWNARPFITETRFGHVEYEGFRVGVRWRW